MMEHNELGEQLGQALRTRVAATPMRPLDLESVRTGARRRRAMHRGGAALVCVALVAAAGVALAARVKDPVVSDDGAVPIVRPTMLPAYAVLDGAPGVGDPVVMSANRGGPPYGSAMPRIDVWQSGGQRLVIRTVDNSTLVPSPGVTTSAAPPDTEVTEPGGGQPWGGREVEPVRIRGVDGAIEELAADQFAVWIPTDSVDRYTLVIGRGMTREEVVQAVEAMDDSSGVLQPSTDYTLAESAAEVPASTASSGYAFQAYSFDNGPFVSSWLPPAGRNSIELAPSEDIGRIETLNGRQVMLTDQPWGRSEATWIDPSGAVVGVWRNTLGVSELVPFVRTVSEAEWIKQSKAVSARLTSDLPVTRETSMGSTTLVYRSKGEAQALCLVSDASETCVAAQQYGQPQVSTSNSVEINGRWIIFGYYEVTPENEQYTHIDQLKFATAGSACCKVEWVKQDGAYWYVVHVDDNVDVVDTNLGDVFGGPVGSISRPLAASNI